jgi:hypothetical protein
MAQDEDGEITMNHVDRGGYKPLPRTTNLGWQKAQTKSHSLLSSSHQEHSKKKEHTHLSSQKRWLPNQQLHWTKDQSAPTLGVTTHAHARAFWSTHD